MERKEAIKIVRKLYNESLFIKKDKEAMVTLIPELEESEDGRIRKWIIEFIKACRWQETFEINKDQCLAWLEAQGEQKPAWSEEDDERFESCIKVLQTSDEYDTINAKWLKSLKDRVGCEVNCTTTKNWSEKDKVKINRIVACLENLNVADNDILLKDVAWLTLDKAERAVEIAREELIDKVKALLLSEVLPCFMHGGEADEVVAMLDEKLLKDE